MYYPTYQYHIIRKKNATDIRVSLGLIVQRKHTGLVIQILRGQK